VVRKEPTKLYLLGKRVPEERQILTTGFNPVKKRKVVVVVFFRGAYATIAIIVSPFGLLENGKKKRKKKSGLTFFEGLTPPSLSLCRPSGFWKMGRRKEKKVGAYIFRGAYATIAIPVSPFGLFFQILFFKIP
jgi:hypothetical protein